MTEAKNKVTGKVAKTIYLSQETNRRLKAAADDQAMSESVYVEQTLRERFRKDGVQ